MSCDFKISHNRDGSAYVSFKNAGTCEKFCAKHKLQHLSRVNFDGWQNAIFVRCEFVQRKLVWISKGAHPLHAELFARIGSDIATDPQKLPVLMPNVNSS